MISKQVITYLAIFFAFLFIYSASPRFGAEYPQVFKIEEGESLPKVAARLSEMGVLRDEKVLQFFVVISGNEKNVQVGEYNIKYPMFAWSLAKYITSPAELSEQIKVTIPEGSRINDIASIANDSLPDFDEAYFVSKYNDKEGYLFPDTYYFWPSASADEVAEMMMRNFDSKISELDFTSAPNDLSKDEVIVLASIIENESYVNDKKTISGILHNRLRINMALQVDATLDYILGKSSSELTLDDLKISSPYNTYVVTGLPPTPISNPGLASIEAAIYPEETSYMFYLHDKDGNTYYSTDFEGHVANKMKYLD